jgi:hypothetical protein
MNNILISHDSRDEKIALEIKYFLEDIFLNFNFYVSGRDLVGGQIWIEQIKNSLKSSQVIISLITSNSINNNWVYFESGAGFTEDKTIPLLIGGLKPESLRPPLSLLQVRVLNNDGFESFIKDISEKLGLRTPRSYPNVSGLVNKIEKLSCAHNVLKLQELLVKDTSARNSAKQWIFKETCLVHDFIIENIYKVSIDTVFSMDKWEIQLFGREGSESYVSDMINKDGFLPRSGNDYVRRGNRLLFKEMTSNEDVGIIEQALADLLFRIEDYKNKVSG